MVETDLQFDGPFKILRLIAEWDKFLEEFGVPPARILLTRSQYLGYYESFYNVKVGQTDIPAGVPRRVDFRGVKIYLIKD